YRADRRHALELAEGPVPITFKINLEDGTVYIDIEFDAPLARAPVQTLASPEWPSGSLPISLASLTIPSPIASPVTTPTTTIVVDKDEFLEVGAQLELHGSILHDHTQCLDALPPTLFKGYGQEQATITFGALWRPVLALEAWAGHIDAQRAALWQARYVDQREIHALRVQHTVDQCEMQELREHVATLERRMDRLKREDRLA
ncbi:hypothetical protein Tco_0844286, partial [Tanacetum coccineum]